MKQVKVITIDGPAGAGKSTVAKRLAKELDISYLDTGAMYRALTLKAMRCQLDLLDEESLVAMAQETTIDLANGKVFLDGQDVSEDIRTVEVTNQTFLLAKKPRIRSIMVEWQRHLGAEKDVVVEGRDAGTVIFPDAQYKFYLDANLKERSRRRLAELQEKGKAVDAGQLTEELKDRDDKDFTRQVGPLKKACDAIVIDSTHFSIDGVIEEMMNHIDTQ